MAPLPTIADVFRCAFTWINGAGNQTTNVLHFRCTGTVDDVAQALFDVFDDAGFQNPWGALDSDYEITSVNITPLDGVTASSDHALPGTNGGGTGDQIPNMAMVISEKTGQRGARGRGRVFVGPVSEGQSNGGFFDSGFAAAVLSNWDDFHDALVASTPSVVPVVASYVHEDAHDITSYRVDIKAGTQRRRLQRL